MGNPRKKRRARQCDVEELRGHFVGNFKMYRVACPVYQNCSYHCTCADLGKCDVQRMAGKFAQNPAQNTHCLGIRNG